MKIYNEIKLNDLEHLQKSDVYNFNGISYKEFRKSLEPDYAIVWRDILLGLCTIALLGILAAYIERKFPDWFWINIPLAGFLIGYSFAYLELFLHEAAHYNIHPTQKINDWLATWLLGIWVGTNIKSYRKIHWDHHRFLGTMNDSENSYFNALNLKFIIENLFGIHALRIILQRNKRLSTKPEAGVESTGGNKWFLLGGFALNFSVSAALLFLGYWQVGLIWLTAVFAFYPLFASLRQLLEHRDDNALSNIDYSKTDHGKLTRIFKPGFVENTFGGAGFNRHMLHHWDPQLSYTRLKDLERFLRQTPQCKEIIENSRTTYQTVFLRLFKFSLTA